MVLPDCTTVPDLGDSEQGIWYTTPVHWSMGQVHTQSLWWTSWRLQTVEIFKYVARAKELNDAAHIQMYTFQFHSESTVL